MVGRIIGSGASTRYLLDGQEVCREEFFKAFPRKKVQGGAKQCSLIGWKPIVSEAAAVHPSQIAEAREHDRKHGVPTEYTSDGRPIFRTRQHRRAYLKSWGFHDRSGGYGDG